jgi:lipopolysaccharide/colanic/teichoic acid biosynthesis glycosyltransferase
VSTTAGVGRSFGLRWKRAVDAVENPSRFDRFAKRSMDVVVAALSLLLLSPLFLVVAVALAIDSPGPVFFRQRRLGLDGRSFTLLKFRSMRTDGNDAAHRQYVTQMLQNASVERGPSGMFKLEKDPRITRVGALLRRTSIDELPQLVNVLLGSMSLVGPRPVLAWEAEHFSDEERLRFATKPGITGLWQVSGRNRLTMKEALALDVQYVRTRTLLADAVILLATVPALLRDPGR